jgi:hypothetical protein
MTIVVEQMAVTAITDLTRRSLSAVLEMIRSRRTRPPAASGSREDRLAAYQAFRSSAVEAYTELVVLHQLRAGLLGSVLNLPLKLSIFRRLPRVLARLQDATLGVCMVGSASVVESVEAFTDVLFLAASASAAKPWSRRPTVESIELWDKASTALGEFVAVARKDLEISAVSSELPTRGRRN